MAKKILALCAALVAFAALPAVASAANSPELLENGSALATGTNIQATNTEATLMTDSEENTLLSCDTATMTGALTKNDGSNIEGNITAASFKNHASAKCSGSIGATEVTANPATNGLNWCIRSTSTMATNEFQVRGNSCSSLARPIRFILHVPLIGACTYQRTSAINGTYTTGSETTLSISKVEFPKLEGSSLCPPAGYLDMKFLLETDGNTTRLEIQNK